jgi:hypothetical protein
MRVAARGSDNKQFHKIRPLKNFNINFPVKLLTARYCKTALY